VEKIFDTKTDVLGQNFFIAEGGHCARFDCCAGCAVGRVCYVFIYIFVYIFSDGVRDAIAAAY
jgi:hypothetical protein